MIGNYELALQYARLIHENVTSSVLLSPVLAKYFESFVSIDIHVLVRFGKWNKILHYQFPDREVIIILVYLCLLIDLLIY